MSFAHQLMLTRLLCLRHSDRKFPTDAPQAGMAELFRSLQCNNQVTLSKATKTSNREAMRAQVHACKI